MSGLALSNPKVQRLRRLLGRRSARDEEGVLVVEGPTLLREAQAAGWTIEAVFVPEGAADEPTAGAPVFELAPGVLERVATTKHAQPVLAVVERRSWSLADLHGADFLVVLAGVSDPGNAGTILRSAEAAGADGVVTTLGSVDLTNPKVVRASAGAIFHVPTVESVMPATLTTLGLPLLGAAVDGVPHTDAALDGPLALVVGNEAHGLPDDLALDGRVGVRQAGRAESLNVAMAATVICFEVARRRDYAARRAVDATDAPVAAISPPPGTARGRSGASLTPAAHDEPARGIQSRPESS